MKELLKFKEIFNYKAVIFDLDNTLYDETEFLFPAYKVISNYIANKSGYNANAYETYLIDSFSNFGRSYLFDKLIYDFQLQNITTVEELLKILHSYQPSLAIYENVLSIIEELIFKEKTLFILTNGNHIQQRNKITALNIPIRFPMITVIYANEFKPKPSPYCVNLIMKKYKIKNTQILIVGDSFIDKSTAENSDIDFLNISNITNYGIE